MKFIITILSLLITGSLGFAIQGLPPIPEGCFDNYAYCTNWSVTPNEEGLRVIRVKLFVILDADNFENEDEILNRYFDFNQWAHFSEGSGDITFKKSIKLGPIVENGITKQRHYAHYLTKAPWPISTMEIREVAYHWFLPPVEGADKTLFFETITDKVHKIEGEEPLHGAEGVKLKKGTLHLRYDKEQNAYIAYLINDVIPSIDILPEVGAPYIERSLVGLFKGMFEML